MTADVKLCITLSESWTMTEPRDLQKFAGLARVAEQAGIYGVMVGEHVAMGPNSSVKGPPLNPRDWLGEANQPSRYPHPANLPILSAMAAVTSKVQLIAAAVLSVMRPPLVMAKEFATVDLISRGRLVVVPTVSWQREEYEAMGIDFGQRGRMLDEQLEIWHQLWNGGSPVSFNGRFYQFSEMYSEPSPYRDDGPQLWVGGFAFSPWFLRRTVQYGAGIFPIVAPTEEQMTELADAMKAAGRDVSELEMATVIPTPAFTDATGLLDLDATIANAPELVAKGFSTLIIKPSQYIDDGDQLGDFCQTALRKLKTALAT